MKNKMTMTAEDIQQYGQDLILCARCESKPVDKTGAVCGACVDEIDHN